MAASETTKKVTETVWEITGLDEAREFEDAMVALGLATTFKRTPSAATDSQINIEVAVPSRPNGPVIVDVLPMSVRAVAMDDTIISLEVVGVDPLVIAERIRAPHTSSSRRHR